LGFWSLTYVLNGTKTASVVGLTVQRAEQALELRLQPLSANDAVGSVGGRVEFRDPLGTRDVQRHSWENGRVEQQVVARADRADSRPEVGALEVIDVLRGAGEEMSRCEQRRCLEVGGHVVVLEHAPVARKIEPQRDDLDRHACRR
jgi:hypothetical protein